MMQLKSGNLLEADVEALVNTVNCVGVMGKGIALQFKRAFPDNTRAYELACKSKELVPGRMLVFETGTPENPKLIVNFPTKDHWKGKSTIEFIQMGLKALIDEIAKRRINSIAIPALGCGNGGLDWSNVFPLIEEAFCSLPEVAVHVYPPATASK
jgi:O-acetyl-ADP-ribose deacetylase (regulator of RNase III)